MSKYLIEGFARQVGAIGVIGHVCFTVEADSESGAIAEAYKTHEHFSRMPNAVSDNGPLIRVSLLSPCARLEGE